MRINRKKQLGKHAVISGIRMPQLRCTRVSESDILRRASLALCACLLFTAVFVGCGTEASDEPVDPNRLQVMASFYTMYDFAQKIGGEHVQVTCMVPSGTEPHDWEPSTKDITRMEQADVFIYNGAGYIMDKEDVLAGLSNKKLISVEASQGVSLLRSAEEEDGHDHEAAHADEDEEDSHDHDDADAEDAVHEEDAADRVVAAAPDGHDAHEHGEYDPHVWLDPMNAKQEMQNKLNRKDISGVGVKVTFNLSSGKTGVIYYFYEDFENENNNFKHF